MTAAAPPDQFSSTESSLAIGSTDVPAMASKPSRSRFQAHQSSQRVADARSFSLERTCIRTHSWEARLSPGTRSSTYTRTPCPGIGVGRNSERFPLESLIVGPMTVAALGNGAACCETTKVMEVDTFAPENIFASNGLPLASSAAASALCLSTLALNALANRAGMPYDEDGRLAKEGIIIPELLQKLNHLDYYSQKPPKSLGKEWYDEVFSPVLTSFLPNQSLADLSRTVVEHIAVQIIANVPETARTMLVTGGGAHHTFLIQQIQHQRDTLKVIVPDHLIVDYKEALIFAFLGLLRLEGENNCLRSVTGAKKDCCGGCVY